MSDPIITLADIKKIAGLASLDLSPAEEEQLLVQFEDILAYFRKIDEAPLPELHDHPPDAAEHLREDVAVKSGVSPDTFSPHLEDGHFKVPRVIEEALPTPSRCKDP